MTPEEKEKLKISIIEGIKDIKRDIEALTELSKPIPPDNAIGRITRMEAINSKSINEAALTTARNKLAGLQRAIDQIDDLDFGYCAVCEELIPLKRLMLMPESNMCVKCAS